MRVLHVYAAQYFGGIETFLITLARCRLHSPGMKPEFALCFDGFLSQELEAQNVTIHRLGNVRMRHPLTVLRARRMMQKLLQLGKFDVVVSHSIWNQFIFGPVVRRAGIPLVFYQHNTFLGNHWFEHWAARVPPDFVICNSRYTQTTLANIYPGVQSQVMYFPVSLPKYFSAEDRANTRSELQTPAEAIVVIQASQMAPWKGHVLHLNALARLAHVPGWVTWIVGGPQLPAQRQYFVALKEQAAHLGISDRVRFLGTRTDVSRLLAAANIFCQPNLGTPEPFGIALVEALGAGLPVVSTALGGVLEIVDDSCGLLVPPGDTESLAAALERLLTEPRVRRQLAEHAPERARLLCAPERQMSVLEQLLSAAIGAKRGNCQKLGGSTDEHGL